VASELDRIRSEYARRAADPNLQKLYSPFRPDVQFAVQTRERAILRLLQREGYCPLDQLDLLEVGCGGGGVQLDLVRWDADPAKLHGCDLIPERAISARGRLPAAISLAVADGGALPYPAARFDLVLQFTVLTSVLDEALRYRIAQEMWRVLRPGGAVLSYDFRFQGRNPAVKAIHPREMRVLFPEGTFMHRRLTLAPPIARRLAKWSWLACELLRVIPWLRTHDLVLIQKAEVGDA
jgi:ubiquinone/menaquinone biosynthesis C-methylase UbiE